MDPSSLQTMHPVPVSYLSLSVSSASLPLHQKLEIVLARLEAPPLNATSACCAGVPYGLKPQPVCRFACGGP